jgi:hypothetical protein
MPDREPAGDVLPPEVYAEARSNAPNVVDVAIAQVITPPAEDLGLCRVIGTVERVKRGSLRIGDTLEFDVSCARPGALLPAGETIWTDMESLAQCCFGRAWLDEAMPSCSLSTRSSTDASMQ